MSRSRRFCAFILLTLLIACGPSEPMTSAVGSYSDVAIVTDLTVLGAVARRVASDLAIPLEYSLKSEPLFNVDVFDVSELRQASVYKNVVVIGLVSGEDRGSHELRKQLSGDTLNDQAHKNLFIALVEDVYAKNQTVLFVAGRQSNVLQSSLTRNKMLVAERLEASNRARLREYLFTDGHELELEARARAEMGFGIEIPASFRETRFLAGSEEGLLEIAKVRPTRAMSVYYKNDVDTQILEDREGLLELRRSWGARFLEENLQDVGGFRWNDEPFQEHRLQVLAGFWEAQEGTFGGPFRTFFLYDEAKRRLYGINLLCYAPGMKKHTYMRETLAVAETLKP